MAEALAVHYANALANAIFAQKPSDQALPPEQAVGQLKQMEELVSGSKELERALLSPAVTKSRKSAVIATLSDELGLHKIIRNFLLVVVTHRRVNDLSAIRRQLELAVDERLGWVPAEIISARELNPGQRDEIEQVLGTKVGKFIRAHYKVDPSLLAGVRAHVASKQYDASLRGKLEAMRQRLVPQV
jgi:F-type H+-transporting ATPase subunit delta